MNLIPMYPWNGGWIRGMGKDVLYLVEKTFDLGRADISGLIQDKFSWEDPENDIKKAIHVWLTP